MTHLLITYLLSYANVYYLVKKKTPDTLQKPLFHSHYADENTSKIHRVAPNLTCVFSDQIWASP